MPAMVICMASAKGGSGKTVLTATFSAFLAALGKRVLMIDTDAATNGLSLMFLKEVMMQSDVALSQRRRARGIYDESSKTDQPEIVKTPIGAHLIPATYRFINTEGVPVSQFEASLQEILLLLTTDYDFIFLDAQAGADPIAHISMSQKYSDQVVIVSEYDPLSAAGVERLKGLFREDLTYVRTWILLNKMLPDFVQSFSDFMEVAKYASPIPWDADVVRAYARRRLALDLERGNEFTLALVQTLRSILGDEVGADLDKWLSSRIAALRAPVETQYADAEHELEALISERAFSQYQRNRRRRELFLSVLVAATSFSPLTYIAMKYWKYPPFDIWIVLPVLLGILGAAAALLFELRSKRQETVSNDVEEARFQRQRDVIQERLKKLEALRSADASTLLKARR
jgi:cellulose biosynthesis protein BcsQ